MTLWAFRVGEDSKVLFPVMVHLDGFTLSHVTEPVILPEQSEVDRFLPEFQYPFALNPEKPMTHGAFGPPEIYSETKVAQELAFRKSKKLILQGWEEFGDIFGRHYSPVELYKTEGAKTLLLTVGSYSDTAKMLIDKRQAEGESVGLIRLRLWRPFPFEELRQVVKGAETLIVFERCISFGMGGPIFSEVRSALYDEKPRPMVVSIIGGLGGRDVTDKDFGYVIDKGKEIAGKKSATVLDTVGIRG